MRHRPSNPLLRSGLAVLLVIAVAGQQQDQLALKSKEAKSLLAQGRFADAIPLYEELVKALPGNPGLRLNLGIAEHMAGRDREAAPTLGEVLRVEPNHGPALAMCGASYLRLGDPAKAVGFLERASRVMPPGEPRIWAGLGHSYEALSEEAFARLDSLAPGSPCWLALAAETRLSSASFAALWQLFREALAKLNRRDWRESVAAIYQQTDHQDWASAEKGKAAQLAPPAVRQAHRRVPFSG